MKTLLVASVVCGLLLTGCATHACRMNQGMVTLTLRRPGAHRVDVCCSLDGFRPHPARAACGTWTVTLPASEGFRYFYRVDGVIVVPDCPMTETDDFGAQNCVFDPAL